jgi:hypothetical protein
MPTLYSTSKRFRIFMLAALSITILLFTVTHSHHFISRSRNLAEMHGKKDCGGLFYADEMLDCLSQKAGSKREMESLMQIPLIDEVKEVMVEVGKEGGNEGEGGEGKLGLRGT